MCALLIYPYKVANTVNMACVLRASSLPRGPSCLLEHTGFDKLSASRLTSIKIPGLKPNGLASVLGTSAGPGLRSKRHDRPGEAIVRSSTNGRCCCVGRFRRRVGARHIAAGLGTSLVRRRFPRCPGWPPRRTTRQPQSALSLIYLLWTERVRYLRTGWGRTQYLTRSVDC